MAKSMLQRKQATLNNLEAAMGPDVVQKVSEASEKEDGSQFRPRGIESPSRLAILREIQEEEEQQSLASAELQGQGGRRSVRMSQSVGINMGLDIEMKQ
jgi:hypothetical protein